MKKMKKFFAMLIAMVMVLAMSMNVFAAGTGSITVKNATKGYDYKAYKVFDATYTGEGTSAKVSYTTPAANASKLDNTIFGWSTAADADGNISVWVKDGVDDATVTDWVSAHYSDFGGTAIDGVFDTTNSTVTFSDLDFGYYYITSGLGTTVTIDSAAPSATVYDKNNSSDANATKKIVKVDGTEVGDLKNTDAHVGSVISFQVDAITTNWVYKGDDPEGWVIRDKWEITDTPTSMTIDENSVKVYVNNTELTTGYTATVGTDGELTVNIPMIDENGNSVFEANHGDKAGQIPVKVTYDATITEAAGTTAAKNKIPTDEVTINVYEFDIHKVDGTDKDLLGAKFEIYNGKTKLTFSKNDAGDYVYDAEGTIDQIDLTEVAKAHITGLDKWTLTVKEVVVPEGYNQAEDETAKAENLIVVGQDGSYEIKVINQAGAELPSTGGMGTTMFYVIGAILMAGAGVVLVSRRRMAR